MSLWKGTSCYGSKAESRIPVIDNRNNGFLFLPRLFQDSPARPKDHGAAVGSEAGQAGGP